MKKMMYISEWVTFIGAMFTPSFLLFMAWWYGEHSMTMAFTFFGVCTMLHMHKFDKPEYKN